MKEMPLISVIVPVYRVENYLDKCVRSITAQTYRNLEILLVDDGSPDHSGAICDAWAARDSRIKVIHQENGGGGKARNAALEIAAGALIAFVDSDDYIAPDMLAHLYEIMGDTADISECAFLETLDDEAEFADAPFTVTEYTPEEAMREHIRDTAFQQLIWNKLYRREVIGGIRFPEGTKIDDEFFTYQVLGKAGKLVRSDRVCYAYRQQPDSVMHQKFSLRRLEGLQARHQRFGYIREHMPALTEECAFHLYFFCMYAMQMSMRYLPEEDFTTARGMIRTVLADIPPIALSKNYSIKDTVWLIMARISFEGTCRLRNFLFERE